MWCASPSLIWLALFAAQAGAVYNESDALLHAYLATAAYCGYPKTTQASLEAWACGPACEKVPGMTDVRQILTSDGNDAYAFVAKRDGHCVVAFRGTSNLNGWMKDLDSLKLVDLAKQGVSCSYEGVPCQVGDGFMTNYNSLSAFIKGNLSAIGCTVGVPLTVTGHSLGAAEAAIAQFDLKALGYDIVQTYTFGQPRVGDRTFAGAWERDVGATTSYRVTYHKDPIVHLPFENSKQEKGFAHSGTEVFYDGDVSAGAHVCNGSGEDPTCADKYTDIIGMTLACMTAVKGCDHLKYMTSVKQIPMDGTSCTDSQGTAVVI